MTRKTEKCGKFRNFHCRTWNIARKLKVMENEKFPIQLTTWKMKKSLKNVKNENAHCRTWNMARKLKITENEKYTL